MLIVAVLGVVAVTGVKQSAGVTNVLVVVKVGICLFVIVAGALFVRGANLTPVRAARDADHPEPAG